MFCERRIGGTERWFTGPPADARMLIADELKSCVVFLFARESKRTHGETKPWGTGFFVNVHHPTQPWALFPYLVTARHIVDDLLGRRAFIRINRCDGSAEEVEIDHNHWHFHPDKNVDVAVLDFDPMPDPEVFDYSSIDRASFATDEFIRQRGIGPGDEVFVVGLFGYATGERRNMPIVRMGNLAMIPTETIPTDFGDVEAYLVEARSIGGVSGSPVFVRESLWVTQKGAGPFVAGKGELRPDTMHAVVGGKSWLLGLMHGHWDIPANKRNEIAPAPTEDGVNVGIAIVVPAKKIYEVLDDPGLVQMRKREAGLMRQKLVARLD